ncbi:MAG: hypothetical protein IKM31_10445 [Oscillospiraceae bacterium]|nr:hypothetical protein [Oscillospiraceae bacterium]
MKDRTPLILIELMIMTAVFALAAAWCMQGFAAAGRISEESAARDRAVVEAQNAAELLMHYEGDREAAAARYGGSTDGGCWRIGYDEAWNQGGDAYLLEAVPQETGGLPYGMAKIAVTGKNGETLFEIPAAWQEETE